ncbi:IS200/IS605 family transposase [Nitrosomonas ureae]|uniref:Putative transposase n=1 Tax=Nitrosomonas ureae TaxID=44577 RepID=A0A2T5I8S3_9PROT|nr:IS200/IS605 family transposase [Nitrosomonas ureae]PTQ80232.1 putative transposase [Nitrosomonas ureae]
MKEYQNLNHTRWNCKYHVVFIPKKRKKRIFGLLCKHLGEIFHELAAHEEADIVEGHIMSDHVHRCISIPPKYAVSNVMGYIKRKSAIAIAWRFRRACKGFHWRGSLGSEYFLDSGLDEGIIRSYIRNQEHENEHSAQMKLDV